MLRINNMIKDYETYYGFIYTYIYIYQNLIYIFIRRKVAYNNNISRLLKSVGRYFFDKSNFINFISTN